MHSSDPRPKMPFGRHRGKPIASLPDDYLAWLADSVDLRPPLSGHVAAELARRASRVETRYPPAHLPDLRSTLDIWRRTLAVKYHPDRGGNPETMKALNDAADLLIEMVEVRQ